MKYYYSIDIIKCCAIISVIFLHLIPKPLLISLYSEFHIWQAVPVFMFIAGFNSTLAINKRRDKPVLPYYFKGHFFKKLGQRILIPFLFIFAVELIFKHVKGEFGALESIVTLFKGGYGPGSYYIPIYIQHLFLFPLLLLFYESKFNFYSKLIFMFLVSVFLDALLTFVKLDAEIYRILAVRYLFVIYLGIAFFKDSAKIMKPLLVAFSLGYILLNHFYQERFCAIFNCSWGFQHAPAYFYTAFIFHMIYKLNDIKQWKIVKLISAGTFHIFLFQMFYFAFLFGLVKAFVSANIDGIALSNMIIFAFSVICTVSLGLVFKKCNDYFL